MSSKLRISTGTLAALFAAAAALVAVYELTRPPFADRYGLFAFGLCCLAAGYLLGPGARESVSRSVQRWGADGRFAEVDARARADAQKRKEAISVH